jgi:hypothetical protein
MRSSIPRGSAGFYDFDEYERLVAATRVTEWNAYLIVLFDGEADLRFGEMMALEWSDVDLGKRQPGALSTRRLIAHSEDRPGPRSTISPTRAARQKRRASTAAHVCSHLAMRGAPARGLAGYQDLDTTQRHMNLTPGGARCRNSVARNGN